MEQVELVRRCQQGDRQAMGLLYTDMHDELLGICRHYVTDSATAEDLLHDSFLLIFSKIGDLRLPEKAKGWMHTVVKNVALLYLQRKKQQQVVALEAIVQRPETDNDMMPLFITYEELMKHVEALPKGCQQVFRLAVFEGMSHQQIAELLNIEPHSSSSQLFHAKDLLRRSLGVLLMAVLMLAIPTVVYRFLKEGEVGQEMQQKPVTARGEESQGGNPERRGNATTNWTKQTGLYSSGVLADALVKNEENRRDEAGLEESDSIESIDDSAKTADANGFTSGKPDVLEIQETPELPESLDDLENLVPSKPSPSKLSLALAYSGLSNANHSSLPYGTEDMNGEIDTIAHHRMPLTIGLDIRYRISPRISLLGGVRYTSLSSEFKKGNTYLHIDRNQHVNYLGLLLGANYQLWKYRVWNLYGSASTMYEFPLRSTLHTIYFRDDVVQEEGDERLSIKKQWSIGAGLGLQYDITPSVGVYVEPSMQYFFQRENDIETWRTMHPFTFSLPVGIRITF